jgi:hypothetical protein
MKTVFICRSLRRIFDSQNLCCIYGSVAELNQRFQILLSEDQIRFLKEKSRRSGQSVADLIRLAVEHTYRPREVPAWEQALESLAEFSMPVPEFTESHFRK